MSNVKIAIVALTRGYKEESSYELLLKRNQYLSNIIDFTNSKYEFILFHEGNIGYNHQEYINQRSKIQHKFIDVSVNFKITNELKNSALIEKFRNYGDHSGYRLMCRFNMYYIWTYLKDYDYIFRVDEDVLITEFDEKQFEIMINKNIDFCFPKLINETHEFTNKYLPAYLENLFNIKSKKIYNHKFPYTNVYIAKVKTWKKEEILQNLKKIAVSNEQYKYRWGDLPVLGAFINYYKMDARYFKNIKYMHASHDTVISCNDGLVNKLIDLYGIKLSQIKLSLKTMFQIKN